MQFYGYFCKVKNRIGKIFIWKYLLITTSQVVIHNRANQNAVNCVTIMIG